MPFAPGSTLGPYTIAAELGRGGMGFVYTADDPRLKRQVAIKLLPPDLTRDDTAKQRFLQEAQAASALDHPNICTIHEINETDDGQLYLVMAHYEGETLKKRIERGPLPHDEAVDIATQVGQGLSKAHAAGIVHRDIKPANLMDTADGTVKILDFGLAKLTGTEGVTQTGTTVGTVAYMSPEQARGEEVDHRTDIWSLGVVLYEMLSGHQPFRGDNLLAISGAIQQDPPPALTGDSSSLSGVVMRSLDKSQSQRYSAITDLLADLRGAAGPAGQETSPSDVPSIAVLPFADMSPQKDQDYFCEGMAEEIIGALTEVDGLRVAARTSTFNARAKKLEIAEIGERLNVSTVLDGSVRRAGNRARIAVQLISVRDGFQLWSQRFDRDLDDIFAVQDEIACAVTQQLNVTIRTQREGTSPRAPTTNMEAYTAYLKGRLCIRQRGAFKQALDNFSTAVELDATFAAAHAWDWQRAGEHFRRALDLRPESGDAHSRYGCYLSWIHGRVDEAAVEARQAMEADPMDPHSYQWLGIILCPGKRPSEAIPLLRRALQMEPNWVANHFLGESHRLAGDYEEAIEYGRTAVELSGRHPWALGEYGVALVSDGERESATNVYDELVARSRSHGAPVHVAGLCAALGKMDEAFQFLERAYETRDSWCIHLRAAPLVDRLRADPRFDAHLRRMSFPDTDSNGASQADRPLPRPLPPRRGQ